MKYISISLSDPKYQHEASLASRIFKGTATDTIRVPINTKFGCTKLFTQISVNDAQNLARIIGVPSFCYLPIYNKSNRRVSLYNRPNVFDPKDKLPSIDIWDSGMVFPYNWRRNANLPFMYATFAKKIRKYLVDNGYLLLEHYSFN